MSREPVTPREKAVADFRPTREAMAEAARKAAADAARREHVG